MDSLRIYNKIDSLRKDKGLSKNSLCVQAGVSSNTFYNWQTRATMPTFEVVEALCDILQISVPQLLSDEPLDDLPEEHKKLLSEWSTLNRSQKELIMNMMKSLRSVKI